MTAPTLRSAFTGRRESVTASHVLTFTVSRRSMLTEVVAPRGLPVAIRGDSIPRDSFGETLTQTTETLGPPRDGERVAEEALLVITGIALPAGSDKLYTGSKDESVRIWDCQTGQCVGVINLGGEVGCMISEGPWIFVGIPNSIKAWNTQTATELSLSGPTGQVYAMTVGNEMLFTGSQDGRILAWKFSAVGNCFEPAASLVGHRLPVITLVVGAMRLYSGSMDNTIRVWDISTLQCIQTLTDHTAAVMSVLCWDQFLLSCSLDHTVKVWVATESGSLEVTYTHTEEHGALTLCGMHDAQAKPILFASCNDNIIRLYDLPSFNERGKIYSKEEVRAIQVGPGGLFFTGDGSGDIKVWKWLTNEAMAA
ncbi:hypothetical protein HPP92_014147 [Vanilla planifolia]|uniref:IP5PC-F beta-propeller domain-containing protein n=1 Tax=Vanilla planifolia TaxID=51239 RepID=A0A835UWL4_VANPL|nr:hypothetical protein HPP92_014147 [Vanilla planifolia]